MKHILVLLIAGILSTQMAWSGEKAAFAELTAAGVMNEVVSVPLPGAPAEAAKGVSGLAPDVLVRTMIEKLMKIIKTAPKDEVLALLLPNFNFEHMTILATGKYWQPATEEQKKALIREFSKLLVQTYSNTLDLLDSSSAIEVQPLSPQPAPGQALVKTVVKQAGQSAFTIDYQMESIGDTWKAYDISIDGISLIRNYRGQFASVIASSGMDGLIKLLAEKNGK